MPTNALLKTNTSGTWNSTTGFSYSTLPTISGIAHKDQIEVERKFTVPSGTVLTQEDFRKIYVIASSNYTVDETNKKIIAFSSSFPSYVTKAGVTITIPAITNGASITVRRKSISSESLVTWIDGTRLTASQLNLQTSQLVNLTQELLDRLNYEYVTASDLEYNFGYIWATRSWVEGRLGALPSGQSVKTYVDAADANLQTQVNSAVAMNTTQNGRLDAIESLNTSQTSSINTLNTRVSPSTNLTGTYSASNLSAAVNGLDTRVTATESTNTTQTNNITALQNKVDVSTALSNSYASLTAGVNNLHTRVSATESTNTSQGSAITALQTKVGAGTVTGTIVPNGSDIITAINTIDNYVINAVTTSSNTIFNGHAQGRIVYAGANGTKDSTANFIITPSSTSPTLLTLTGNQYISGNLTQVGVLNLTSDTTSVLNLTGTFTVNADSATVPTFKGASAQKIIAFKNSSNVEVNAIDQYGNLTGRATAIYGAGAPTNPIAGTIWYDSSNTAFKIYNGSAWYQISTTTLANYVGLSGNETVAGNKTFSGLTTFSNTATASTGTNLPFKAQRTNNGNIAEFWSYDGTNNPRFIISADETVGTTLTHSWNQLILGNNAYNLIFKIGDNEAARFNGTNFGIGTTTPKAKLDITTNYTGSYTIRKIYKTWGIPVNTDYSHVYLKLFRLPQAISDNWNQTSFTMIGTFLASRPNDLGATNSIYAYISKAYSTTTTTNLEGCVHFGYTSFEGGTDSIQLVKVNQNGENWVCLYFDAPSANIQSWSFDGMVHLYDNAISANKHILDLGDPTITVQPTSPPTKDPAIHTTLAYTARKIELGDFAGTAMSIGSGEDASSVANTPLIVTNDGDTNLAVRDSTNNVELMNKVSSTGATIGTVTNHPLVINTNNAAAVTIETDKQIHLDTSKLYAQSNAQLTIRNSPNAIEWGHENQNGWVNTLGYKASQGHGFIAFGAEAGSTSNTYRVRGRYPSIIESETSLTDSKLHFGGVYSNNLDNATFEKQITFLTSGTGLVNGVVGLIGGRIGINQTIPLNSLHIKDGGICYERTGNTSRIYTNVGSGYTTGNSTGAIVIQIPAFNWMDDFNNTNVINSMLDITIEGRNYVPSASWTIKISTYLNGSSPQWYGSSAQIIGRCPFNRVRLGYDTLTGYPVIILGETTTTFSYPDIRVTNVAVSYTDQNSQIFSSGWGISFGVTDLTTYTLNYNGSNPVIAYSLDTSGIPTFRTNAIFENSIGIGTTTPNTVAGSTWSNIGLNIVNNAEGRLAIQGVTKAQLVLVDTSAINTKAWVLESNDDYFNICSSTNAGVTSARLTVTDGITAIGNLSYDSQLWIYSASSTGQTSNAGGLTIHNSNASRQLNLGVNDTNSTTWIQGWVPGTGASNLTLQPTSGNVGIGTNTPTEKLTVNGSLGVSGTLTVSSNNKIVVPTVETSVVQSSGTLEFRGDYDAVGGSTADMTINSSGVVVFNQPPLYGTTPLAYPETMVTAQANTATSGFRYGTGFGTYSQAGDFNYAVHYVKVGKVVYVNGILINTSAAAITLSDSVAILKGLPAPAYRTMVATPSVLNYSASTYYSMFRMDIKTNGDLCLEHFSGNQVSVVLPSIASGTGNYVNVTFSYIAA